MNNDKIIYCIGDSHANFFSGQDLIQPEWPEKANNLIPFFRSFRLGPVLAYNLSETNTTTRGREKLFQLLESIPIGSKVLLCFGEIDCRAHLLKQSEIQNKPLEEIVENCIKRYYSVIMEVKEMGYDVLVWNVIASSWKDSTNNPEFPSYGTTIERNNVTQIFNNILNKYLKEVNIPFISIFKYLVDKAGRTKRKYYMDEVHLSQRAMLKTIKEIRKQISDFDIKGYYPFFNLLFYLLKMNLQKIINILLIIYSIFKRKIIYKKYLKHFYKLPTIKLTEIINTDMTCIPPILNDICLPPYFGPKDHDDYTPLMKIMKHFNPKYVLELGTAHGNTVANICNNLPNTFVYTVNAPTEMQTGEITTFNLSYDDIGRVYRSFGFKDRVVQIFENTLTMDLSKYIDGEILDFVIIDACHDTEYVINDFYKVLPFLRHGAVVLFHDTHPSMLSHLIGSYTACMKLRKEGFDIKHIENTWWGFWFKK